MNKELKTVFRNSAITTIILFIYGLLIWQNSIFIGTTLGGILSIWNLYSIYKDAEVLIYKKNASIKQGVVSYSKRYLINGIFLFLMIYIDGKSNFKMQWFVSGIFGLLIVKFNILLIMFGHQFNNIIKKFKNN